MVDKNTFQKKYGPYALVTGTTSGIGKAIVEQLASFGFDLVLVARKEKLLTEQAKNLENEFNIKIKTIKADLSVPGVVETIIDETQDIEIGLLVPNAGIEHHGYFTDSLTEIEDKLLQVNVTVPMQLAHHYSKKMSNQRRGGIVFVSSIGAFSTAPYMASYVASKSYILSLGESLHYEFKDKGVDVTVLCPGGTDTPMMANTGIDVAEMGMKLMSPEEVADTALNALGKKSVVIPGKLNNIMVFVMNTILPRKVANNLNQKMAKKLLKI